MLAIISKLMQLFVMTQQIIKFFFLLLFSFCRVQATAQNLNGWTSYGRLSISLEGCDSPSAFSSMYSDTSLNIDFEKSITLECSLGTKLFLRQEFFPTDSNLIRNGYLWAFDSANNANHRFTAKYKMGELIQIVTYAMELDSSMIIDNYSIKGKTLNGSFFQYKNNTISLDGFFNDCLKDSVWVEYYSNRRIKATGNYFPKSIILDIDTDGNLIEVLNYVDTIGVYSCVDFSQIQKKVTDLEKKYNYKVEETIPFLEFPIDIDFKNGLWKYYSKDGSLEKEEVYDKGLLIND